mmetsp:Transcript_69421/g.224504  ORF Transcript_69421/g.224504 Transcript_69421/m.224504 type:complete len:202 (+) Transcript_69421:436-1041(+)
MLTSATSCRDISRLSASSLRTSWRSSRVSRSLPGTPRQARPRPWLKVPRVGWRQVGMRLPIGVSFGFGQHELPLSFLMGERAGHRPGSTMTLSPNSSNVTVPLLSASISAQRIFLSRAGTFTRRRQSSKAFAPSSSSSGPSPCWQNQAKASSTLSKPYRSPKRAETCSQDNEDFSWYCLTIACTNVVKAPGYCMPKASTAL